MNYSQLSTLALPKAPSRPEQCENQASQQMEPQRPKLTIAPVISKSSNLAQLAEKLNSSKLRSQTEQQNNVVVNSSSQTATQNYTASIENRHKLPQLQPSGLTKSPVKISIKPTLSQTLLSPSSLLPSPTPINLTSEQQLAQNNIEFLGENNTTNLINTCTETATSEEKLLGSFGTELENCFDRRVVKPGDSVQLVLDMSQPATPRILVKSIFNDPVGYFPARISNWFSTIIASGRVKLVSKIPKYKTDKTLVVVDVFGQQLRVEDWKSLSGQEKGAWHQLAITLGVPLQHVVSPRALETRIDMSESILAQRNARSIAAAYTATRVKRSCEEISELEHRAKRQKFNISSPVSIHREIEASFIDVPQLATSSPVLSPTTREFSTPVTTIQSVSSLDQSYIDRLFSTLNSDIKVTTSVEISPRLKVTLRPYQMDALQWMANREINPSTNNLAASDMTASTSSVSDSSTSSRPTIAQLPPGWQEMRTSTGKLYYYNEETKQTYWSFPYEQWAQYHDRHTGTTPVSCCGGILADDMGMGKTIQILSLILSNTPPHESQPYPSTPANSWTTLVVCPLTVLNQWLQEIQNNTHPGSVSVYLYHGADRVKDPAFLTKYDVVITTYATLATEYPTNKNETTGPLLHINWYRIVLDEAHTIKDKNTRTAKAAFSLQGPRRWAVTGTPIQNKLNELFSLFHFIKVEPYGDESWWNHVIMKPIRSRDERGLERLRSVLSAVLLRRTKDQKMDGKNPVVDLPPRTVNIHLVELDEKENDFYQQLWLASKETFRSMMAEGTVLKNYAHILEILLRLRQACDHPVLVINDRQRRLQRSSQDKKSLQREVTMSNTEGAEMTEGECCICTEPFAALLLSKCGHSYCESCLKDHVQQYDVPEEAPCFVCAEPLQFDTPQTSAFRDCSMDDLEDQAKLKESENERLNDTMVVDAAYGALSVESESENVQTNDQRDMLRASIGFGALDIPTTTITTYETSATSLHLTGVSSSFQCLQWDSSALPTSPMSGDALIQQNDAGSATESNSWTYLTPTSNYPSMLDVDEPLVKTEEHMEDKPSSAEISTASAMNIDESSHYTADQFPLRSTKIRALMAQLNQIRTNNPTDKAVVFSQWTSMLDLIEVALKEDNIRFVRLDGKVSQKAREQVIHEFRTNPDVWVFLISLKAGGVGLNLVEANHCIVCDPWWNPAIEEQAIDRIHRIGQTKPVYVTRFIMKDTIEERILELQEKKRQLAIGALSRNSKTLKDMRLEELRLLFRD